MVPSPRLCGSHNWQLWSKGIVCAKFRWIFWTQCIIPHAGNAKRIAYAVFSFNFFPCFGFDSCYHLAFTFTAFSSLPNVPFKLRSKDVPSFLLEASLFSLSLFIAFFFLCSHRPGPQLPLVFKPVEWIVFKSLPQKPALSLCQAFSAALVISLHGLSLPAFSPWSYCCCRKSSALNAGEATPETSLISFQELLCTVIFCVDLLWVMQAESQHGLNIKVHLRCLGNK